MIDGILNNLADVCISNSQQVVTAESCTGGLVAKLITDLAGSSQWFERGFVTYSNLAKEQMLGVDEQLLMNDGAVSESVASAMAKGALMHSQAHFSLSITGIAGPGGGTKSKPVGLVCFGWGCYDLQNNEHQNNEIIVKTSSQQFSGDRESVRNKSAFFALESLLEVIKKSPI
jgi:nicotinamide-nucleotide amidase